MEVDDDLSHRNTASEHAQRKRRGNALLAEEMALRRQIERVAARRRALPPGGAPREDYRFVGENGPVRLSELFALDKDTLAIYSFMYGPERVRPCNGCTHFLDGLNGMAEHIRERINFVVVAKSPLERILAFACERGWRNLHFLSTDGNTYDRDYFGDSIGLTAEIRKQQEFKDGEEWDMPMLNVFRRDGAAVRHFWGSELLYVPAEPGQEYRHNDLLDPLWNMFDVTPEGRGDFEPRLSYA